jgi:hypothetical protein
MKSRALVDKLRELMPADWYSQLTFYNFKIGLNSDLCIFFSKIHRLRVLHLYRLRFVVITGLASSRTLPLSLTQMVHF